MNKQAEILLKLLSRSLFDQKIELQSENWEDVLQEAKLQTVVQLAFAGINKSMLSADDLQKWEAASASVIANNIRIIHNHELLHKWMSESEIPYVVLKGCASASYYPIPVYRNMGDVDFLVPSDKLKQAGKALESNGLKPWNEEHIAHIVYRKDGMHLEMHFNVAGLPEGKAGETVREYLADIFQQSALHKTENGEMVFPSPFHHGLVLLLHTCHHMTGEGIGLRHLCDWAVFVNSFSDKEFCDLFEEKLKAVGLWKFAKVLTAISIKYLGVNQKQWAQSDESLVDKLMEDILSGGNFGIKEVGRGLQTMLISDRGKNGVGHTSMQSQFVHSVNNVVRHHWPKAKNHPALLPAGWVYFGGRRIIREMTGKRRKTNVSKLVEDSSRRRDLYSQLHLYESEPDE